MLSFDRRIETVVGSFDISDSSFVSFDSRLECLNPPICFVFEIGKLALLSLQMKTIKLDLKNAREQTTHTGLLIRGKLLLKSSNQVLDLFRVHRLSR